MSEEQLKGLPIFMSTLIRNLKENPSAADLALMREVGVKEIACFWESITNKKSDRFTYDTILQWLRDKKRAAEEAERKKREAEEAERRRIAEEAERKKREAEEAARKKREAEEAAKRAAEELERKKREAEAAAKRAAEEAEQKKREAEAQKKREAEEAERKKREAEAAAKRAMEEAEAKKKRDAEEAERRREAAAVGRCAQCKKLIEDREYLENEGLKLHSACLAAWEEENCPKCTHCKKPIQDDYVTLQRGDVKATLHESCVDAFKKSL